MKSAIRKMTDIKGDDVFIPFVEEKYDEFYIISKQYLKLISKASSIYIVRYFNLLMQQLRYNDDRLMLSNENKKEIRDVLGVDRHRLSKLNRELLSLGLLIKENEYYKIPANIAFYGDRNTKRSLIKTYASKSIKPNINF